AEAFPQLTEWEKDFGSILKGFIKGRTPQQHKGTFSFKNGLKSLTERLATRLKPKILYGQRVSQIDCQSDGSFRLKIQDAQAPELIKQPIRQLVSTIPAHQLSPMIASLDPSFAQQLLHIPYPAVNVVATAYQKPQIDHPLDGFGALHNQLESSETLGTIFTSSIFPNRAPSDQHLLTTFIGGSLHPDKGMAPDEALKEMVRVDHKRFLGMRGQPVFQHVFRWEKAIPQYTQCIPAIRPLVEKWEKQRLFVGGNWWGGIAVSSCLKRAHELAEILCG
ncbi:MAG: protoporphyrinogen oxidase, partial [Bacteroidota bacterium]